VQQHGAMDTHSDAATLMSASTLGRRSAGILAAGCTHGTDMHAFAAGWGCSGPSGGARGCAAAEHVSSSSSRQCSSH
jgi:hypothetical protein